LLDGGLGVAGPEEGAGGAGGTEEAPGGGAAMPQAAARKPLATEEGKPKLTVVPKPSEKKRAEAATAQTMATQQREISVAEFFQKNRHLLGFDNPRKALLTAIKEAVDNSLDACEEARILPEIRVEINPTKHEDRFKLVVQDNGPGIVKEQIGYIFGKLLYGSKFHRLKMSRGQQGIGISAAGMYGQLTTGKPVKITSRTGPDVPAHIYELMINTTKNEPVIVRNDEDPDWKHERGTRIELELVARYQKGRQSIDEYLEETAIACPHVRLVYKTPDGQRRTFPRASQVLPAEPREIRPHPHGLELGLLMKMLKDSKDRWLTAFLHKSFSRVSTPVAKRIVEKAKLRPKAKPSRMQHEDVDALYRAINSTKLMAPPTNCLSPIGQEQIEIGLKKRIKTDFVTAVSRSPSVYRGNPFLVEAGIAWGGEQEPEGLARLLRFANRVPLLYQRTAGAIYDAVVDTSWRNYHVPQSRGALPSGPLTIMVHFASAWVPFTSESKEAIAGYPEIKKEMRLALQECGRRLQQFLRKRRRAAEAERKKGYIEKYIPHIAIGLREILGFTQAEEKRTVKRLKSILEKKTNGNGNGPGKKK
jgi:DNA topoisomerase-6 subunit B